MHIHYPSLFHSKYHTAIIFQLGANLANTISPQLQGLIYLHKENTHGTLSVYAAKQRTCPSIALLLSSSTLLEQCAIITPHTAQQLLWYGPRCDAAAKLCPSGDTGCPQVQSKGVPHSFVLEQEPPLLAGPTPTVHDIHSKPWLLPDECL